MKETTKPEHETLNEEALPASAPTTPHTVPGAVGYAGALAADGPLRPHDANSRIELLTRSPRVLISPEAYMRTCIYVDKAPKEVGWMGTASRLESGDFFIEEVFLLEQEVTEIETVLSVEGREKLIMQLLGDGDDAGFERANKLLFWGHSHVRMGTFASGTDERTMVQFGEEGHEWYLRGIFNKLGHASFTIYNFKDGYRILDAPWAVFDAVSQRVLLEYQPPRFSSGFALTSIIDALRARQPEPVVSSLPDELVPDVALREEVEAEYRLKVKERAPVFIARGLQRFFRPATTPAQALPPAVAEPHSPTEVAAPSLPSCSLAGDEMSPAQYEQEPLPENISGSPPGKQDETQPPSPATAPNQMKGRNQ